jgi:hypothetical protein
MADENHKPTITSNERAALEEILKSIRKVKHGYVQIVIQDSKVVQVDTLEKKRFDKS